MNIEVLLYVYLTVCAGMIVFNIVTAMVLRHADRRTIRVSEDFRRTVEGQLERVRQQQEMDARHRKYLSRKLRRIGNMLAFDRMLEQAYIGDPATVRRYLEQLDSVLIALTADYGGRDRIEAAYFPYMIRKYRLIAFRSFPSIVGTLLKMLEEPSIYCRENAMQALYTTGDADCVLRALRIVDRSDRFYHDKLLSDGLLLFAGSAKELNDQIVAGFSDFSTNMQVTLLNYLRFSTDAYREFAYTLLCDETQDDEIRFACIRYLGKYPLEKARGLLCTLADRTAADRWEYAAIASTALGAYPGDGTVERLKHNLYSPNWYIRCNAARSLNQLGITYARLADVIDGNDRYASEILRYCLAQAEEEERSPVPVC